jgi:hypothetical protein
VLLAGLGLLAGGVSSCALTLLGAAGLVNGTARLLRGRGRHIESGHIHSGAES